MAENINTTTAAIPTATATATANTDADAGLLTAERAAVLTATHSAAYQKAIERVANCIVSVICKGVEQTALIGQNSYEITALHDSCSEVQQAVCEMLEQLGYEVTTDEVEGDSLFLRW